MDSYLYEQLKITNSGISFPNSGIYSWDNFIENQSTIKFFEDFYGIGEEEANFDNMYFYPSIINFFWVEINTPNKNNIRIHFPKGREQRDEFKNLVAFYILQNYNLLDKKDKANDMIKKIFKN